MTKREMERKLKDWEIINGGKDREINRIRKDLEDALNDNKMLKLIDKNKVERIEEKEKSLHITMNNKIQYKFEKNNKDFVVIKGKIGGEWSGIIAKIKYSKRDWNDFIQECIDFGIFENFKTTKEKQEEILRTRKWWVDLKSNNISSVEVNVNRIVDGDTVEVKFDSGETEMIRLRYIDTPELGHYDEYRIYRKYDKEYCPFAIKATNQLKKFVSKKNNRIKISFRNDEEGLMMDKYGRVLAYLKGYSEDVVKKGLAVPMFNFFIPPLLKTILVNGMNYAKENKLGIFNKEENREKREILRQNSIEEQGVK